jgi:hypothetical protein
MTNNQAKFFPLTGVPPRQFNLGDRVQNTWVDDVSGEEYLLEGTIFGYQYQHPFWSNDRDILLRGYAGWVYIVVLTYESGEQVLACPYIHYYEENRLELIEGIDAPEMVLNYEIISDLFGSNWSLLKLLSSCRIAIVSYPEGHRIVVRVPSQEVADCLGQESVQMLAALADLNLSQDVKIKCI